MHTNQNTAMIRCDDLFVDSDAKQFEEICRIIGRYDFDHLIGVTLLGEGRKLWARDKKVLKVPLSRYGTFTNLHLLKLTGEKYFGNNTQLVEVLNKEFSEYGSIPALHGLHHYRYDLLIHEKVYEELSAGIELMEKLFNVRVKVFSPPFNAWMRRTEIVCESLDLSVDPCFTGFDTLIRDMNSRQIEQLAKKQSSVEVAYHPYQLPNLGKFELYLKFRRQYCQL